MRSFCLILCLGCLSLGALEEPSILVTPNPESDRLVTFDGSTGMIRLYRTRGGRGNDALELKSYHNFIYDFQKLLRITASAPNPIHAYDPENEPKEVDYPMLQLGRNTKPTYAEFFRQTRPYFNTRKPGPDQDPEYVRAFRTELEFWGGDLKYDGRAWAAISGGYVMVYVPSVNTIMLYYLENEDLKLKAYRNIRPELMLHITDGFDFKSFPLFNDLKNKLKGMQGGAGALARRAANLAKMMEEMENADRVMPVAPSDPFLASMTNDRFVLLDMANKRLATYQYTNTLELNSLRNIELDLMLPSWPLPRNDIDAIAKFQVHAYMQRLRRTRQSGEIDALVKQILAWVAEQKFKYLRVDDKHAQLLIFRKFSVVSDALLVEGGGVSKPWDARLIRTQQGQQLVVDLKSSRRLLVYDPSRRGNKIELVAAQSYDVDSAMTDYSERLRMILTAREFYDKIKKHFRYQGRCAWCLKQIEYLLKISPRHHEVIEKDSAFKAWLRHADALDKKDPTLGLMNKYQALVEKAVKDVEARQGRWDKLVELVQQDLTAEADALVLAKEGKLPPREKPKPEEKKPD